jgi:hypothetical protein
VTLTKHKVTGNVVEAKYFSYRVQVCFCEPLVTLRAYKLRIYCGVYMSCLSQRQACLPFAEVFRVSVGATRSCSVLL